MPAIATSFYVNAGGSELKTSCLLGKHLVSMRRHKTTSLASLHGEIRYFSCIAYLWWFE